MNEHWDWLLACTHSICDKIDNIMQKRMSTIILETGKMETKQIITFLGKWCGNTLAKAKKKRNTWQIGTINVQNKKKK